MLNNILKEVEKMQWSKPSYIDIRLGFEVCAYILFR